MKKQYLLLAFLLLLLAGLTFLSVDKYQSSPKDITLDKAVSQRDTALTNLRIQKDINKVNEDAATATIGKLRTDNTTLTTQKATLCAQIRAAKLPQPVCQ